MGMKSGAISDSQLISSSYLIDDDFAENRFAPSSGRLDFLGTEVLYGAWAANRESKLNILTAA